MRHIKYKDTKQTQNSDMCKYLEYPLCDDDINADIITISGRYPEHRYGINEGCKELIYVVRGQGKVVKKDNGMIDFKSKDMIIIEKSEPYYWVAECKIICVCTPAWYAEQHKIID